MDPQLQEEKGESVLDFSEPFFSKKRKGGLNEEGQSGI
jgi:hypothetical protein